MTNAQYNPGFAELGRKDQPDGYVGIDGSGDVIGTFAQRYDTAANIAAIVLKSGELAYTTDTQETFIGDGVTAGGVFVHQVPRTYLKTFGEGLPALTIADATPENTVYIPCTIGGVYLIRGEVDFSGDSGNQSNFKITLYCNNTLQRSSLQSPLILSTWYDRTTRLVLEQRAKAISLIEAYSPFGANVVLEAPNLTKSESVLAFSAQINPIEGQNPRDFIAVHPSYRTGSSSPATATLYVTSQRIA